LKAEAQECCRDEINPGGREEWTLGSGPPKAKKRYGWTCAGSGNTRDSTQLCRAQLARLQALKSGGMLKRAAADRQVRKDLVACESRERRQSRCESECAFSRRGGECRDKSLGGNGSLREERLIVKTLRAAGRAFGRPGSRGTASRERVSQKGATLSLDTLQDTEIP
jgi:hypothetical protein